MLKIYCDAGSDKRECWHAFAFYFPPVNKLTASIIPQFTLVCKGIRLIINFLPIKTKEKSCFHVSISQFYLFPLSHGFVGSLVDGVAVSSDLLN